MAISIIDQVVEQLKAMPQSLQSEVLKFTLATSKIHGTAGEKLLQFSGAIPLDDLMLIQDAINQNCEQVDLNEW